MTTTDLYKLIEELTDPSPCRYDHNGLCQEHNLHSRPCPHERAKEALESVFQPQPTRILTRHRAPFPKGAG